MDEANARFMQLAPEVYGRYWKTNILRHLGWDYKTLRSWRDGMTKPPRVFIELLEVYHRLGWHYVPAENTVRKVRSHGAIRK